MMGSLAALARRVSLPLAGRRSTCVRTLTASGAEAVTPVLESARPSARCRGSRGDAGPLEVVILVPVVLAMFALVVAYGRATQADTKVEHAAAVGARAAVAAQTAGGGEVRAREVVDASLAQAGVSCEGRSISVSGDYAPGGRVTVTVSCRASLGDLVGLGIPFGTRTLEATATEVVDRTRGGGP